MIEIINFIKSLFRPRYIIVEEKRLDGTIRYIPKVKICFLGNWETLSEGFNEIIYSKYLGSHFFNFEDAQELIEKFKEQEKKKYEKETITDVKVHEL